MSGKKKFWISFIFLAIIVGFSLLFLIENIFGAGWTGPFTGGWSAREDLAAVVFDNKIWVLGGNSQAGDLGDIYTSTNGTSWNQVTPSGQMWSPRRNHGAVVFNRKIWVLGGSAGGVLKNDIWSSSNGTNWDPVTPSGTIWSERQGHAVVVFDNKIWVLGGIDSAGRRNDVWSSVDGRSWVQVKPNDANGWTAREDHAVVVFNRKIWVVGGNTGNDRNDVWSSVDGLNWVLVLANGHGQWSGRYGHTLVVHKGINAVALGMFIIGGRGGGGSNFNNSYYSPDGFTWTADTTNWTTGGRYNHASVNFSRGGNFNPSVWVLGGRNSSGRLSEIWYNF